MATPMSTPTWSVSYSVRKQPPRRRWNQRTLASTVRCKCSYKWYWPKWSRWRWEIPRTIYRWLACHWWRNHWHWSTDIIGRWRRWSTCTLRCIHICYPLALRKKTWVYLFIVVVTFICLKLRGHVNHFSSNRIINKLQFNW